MKWQPIANLRDYFLTQLVSQCHLSRFPVLFVPLFFRRLSNLDFKNDFLFFRRACCRSWTRSTRRRSCRWWTCVRASTRASRRSSTDAASPSASSPTATRWSCSPWSASSPTSCSASSTTRPSPRSRSTSPSSATWPSLSKPLRRTWAASRRTRSHRWVWCGEDYYAWLGLGYKT